MSREDLEQFLTDEGRMKVEAFMAETMAEEANMPARVPDLPCPKCGGELVSLIYCLGGRQFGVGDLCMWGQKEHFHRLCGRCDYSWRTDDVNKPETSRP